MRDHACHSPTSALKVAKLRGLTLLILLVDLETTLDFVNLVTFVDLVDFKRKIKGNFKMKWRS